jgi:hypothetical protein
VDCFGSANARDDSRPLERTYELAVAGLRTRALLKAFAEASLDARPKAVALRVGKCNAHALDGGDRAIRGDLNLLEAFLGARERVSIDVEAEIGEQFCDGCV